MRAITSAGMWRTSLWVALGFALCAGAASAQPNFPTRPITVVIHSRYGGGTDITARLMTAAAGEELGVRMQVVSKEGGSGAKAHQFAAERPRDGYTLLSLTQSHLYTIARGKSVLTIDDVVGVARAMDDPTLIVVPKNSPHQSLQELVAASKKRPLTWGVAQIGGTEHIGLTQFGRAAGIRHRVVPFGSGSRMLQGVLSGAVEASLPNVSEARAQVAEGALRALAVMSAKRLKTFPQVPTTFELGYPVRTSTTRGYWVLKGTPESVVRRLSEALVKAMRQSSFADYLRGAGLDPEESIAGHEVWQRQIRADFAAAQVSLRELGIAP